MTAAGDHRDDADADPTTLAVDHLVRALLPQHNIRVVAAVTGEVAREAARRHGAVGGAAAALGRAATAGLLLATITKDRERLTAELQGDGSLGTLMVDASAGGTVRVYVKNPGASIPALPRAHVPLGRAVGRGGLRVARDLGLREIVSGQTPLVDGEIDSDIEHYLMASEQIPSVLACDTLLGSDLDPESSGGVLLQTLPGSEALQLLELMRARLRTGGLTRALLDQGRMADAEGLARAVLGNEADDLLVLDTRPLRFFCPCSKTRAAGALALLGPGELSAMEVEDEGAEVTCDFCRARHTFTRADLERIRSEATRGRPVS
jgi:molecular chaperone Hsp33